MIEFEVMIRPIKALEALGEEMGNRIGPQLARLKQAAAARADFGAFLGPRGAPRLRGHWPCGKDRPALYEAFSAASRIRGMLP